MFEYLRFQSNPKKIVDLSLLFAQITYPGDLSADIVHHSVVHPKFYTCKH